MHSYPDTGSLISTITRNWVRLHVCCRDCFYLCILLLFQSVAAKMDSPGGVDRVSEKYTLVSILVKIRQGDMKHLNFVLLTNVWAYVIFI